MKKILVLFIISLIVACGKNGVPKLETGTPEDFFKVDSKGLYEALADEPRCDENFMRMNGSMVQNNLEIKSPNEPGLSYGLSLYLFFYKNEKIKLRLKSYKFVTSPRRKVKDFPSQEVELEVTFEEGKINLISEDSQVVGVIYVPEDISEDYIRFEIELDISSLFQGPWGEVNRTLYKTSYYFGIEEGTPCY